MGRESWEGEQAVVKEVEEMVVVRGRTPGRGGGPRTCARGRAQADGTG